MPEIVGPFSIKSTTMGPIEAHIGHLHHLSIPTVATEILNERFGFLKREARKVAPLLSSHIRRALDFRRESNTAIKEIRPVLQYYALLNLSVACTLAYRPAGFEDYRRHGVSDLTPEIEDLSLSSSVAKVSKGAVPLFHSVVSDAPLAGWKPTLIELVGAIPLIGVELEILIGDEFVAITVEESVFQDDKRWRSRVSLKSGATLGKKFRELPSAWLERAMPTLPKQYERAETSQHSVTYLSKNSWANEKSAVKWHKATCMKFINFGGQVVRSAPPQFGGDKAYYVWHGLFGRPLVPTLTACLLFSFFLSSIFRYRPGLSSKLLESELNVITEAFIQESEGLVIPAMRNLLYREELRFSQLESI